MYSSVLLAASVYKSVGYIVAVVVFLAVIVYAFINVRRGRAEVGA